MSGNQIHDNYNILNTHKELPFSYCKDWSKAGDPSAVIYIY